MRVSYTTYSDGELLLFLRQGDEKSFTEIYDRYWKQLFSFAMGKLKDFQLAEEIVHDIFVDFWNRRNKPELMTLFSSNTSPFWYRGYYNNERKYLPASLSQIDSTVQKFKVSHIITGHTIVADTINVWYDGKIINTDTHHAEGKSEALLIESDHYYRVNAEGEKVLLFIAAIA